jgi:hypothetical protein
MTVFRWCGLFHISIFVRLTEAEVSQLFGAFDSNAFGNDRWTQINVWERIARGESTRNDLDDICALPRLQVPSPLPAATPASLTYRVITAMLRAKTLRLSDGVARTAFLIPLVLKGEKLEGGCLLPSPRSRHRRILKGQRTQFCRAPQISDFSVVRMNR